MKRKSINLMLIVVVMLIMILSPTSIMATTKSQSDALSWAQSQVGKGIDADGVYGNQCVDLILAYYDYLGVPRTSGNGADYATNTLPAGWSRVQGAQPQPGDILVYTGGNGGYGHVAIYESDYIHYHQNFNGSYVEKITYKYDNIGLPYWGIIRPNFTAPGTQTISNGRYHIVSALDATKTLDVANGSKDDKANIQLYSSLTTPEQAFDITYLGDGYYKIVNAGSGKSLDVEGAGMTPGTNVQQFTYVDEDQQKWVIKVSEDGYHYNIVSKINGLYLDVKDCNTANGTNIQVWTNNASAAQKWSFVAFGEEDGQTIQDGEYHIATALNMNQVLCVDNSSKENAANIQLHNSLDDPNQVFQVTYLGRGYYKICNKNSGKSLDIPGGTGTCGSNIQQYDWNGEKGQQWIIRDAGDGFYYIISKWNGMYMDAENGQSENGTNVQVWVGNSTEAQKWKFIPWDGSEPVISDVKVTDISESGYTVSCKATDESGIARVQFPTWTLANNQDDLDFDWPTSSMFSGTKNGDIYTFRVNVSEHNNELGIYRTHIYAWDANGNQSVYVVDDITIHGWETDYTVDKAATCSEAGTKSIHCRECGAIKAGSEVSVAKLDHTWDAGKVTTEATCTKTGVRTYTCSKCKTTTTSQIEKAAHSWETTYTVDKEATYESAGSKSIHCSICDTKKSGSEVTIPKLEVNPTPDLTPTPTPAPEPENPFVDVNEGSYYYDAVLWALENEVTSGKDATHFEPAGDCSRAQVVTFLWRSQGCPEPKTTKNPFVDINKNNYYYKAVLWAYENGVTTGTDNTHFSPAATVTRSQFVTFLWRLEGKPDSTIKNPFEDVRVGTYYEKAVLWAVERGITKGKDATHFEPQSSCLRSQVVTFIYRAYA